MHTYVCVCVCLMCIIPERYARKLTSSIVFAIVRSLSMDNFKSMHNLSFMPRIFLLSSTRIFPPIAHTHRSDALLAVLFSLNFSKLAVLGCRWILFVFLFFSFNGKNDFDSTKNCAKKKVFISLCERVNKME